MKSLIKIIFFAYFLLSQSFSINAGEISESEDVKTEKSNVVKQGTPMSEEEIEKKIGRYGEEDEIPEDFQFADAENKLWLDNHLGNITRPISLYYEFEKSGTYEDGFID